MRDYLLDTNHLSAAIRLISPLRERIHLAHRRGVVFGTCIGAICEIEAGIQPSKDVESLSRTLRYVLREVRIWPVDRKTAKIFGELYNVCCRRGIAISHVDLVLASYASQHKLALLSTDRDFEALPEVRTENWLR